MASMVYRFQEVLTVLSANTKGLTTAELLAECKKQPGSELPDDTDVLSKLLWTMRSKGLLSSSDAKGGKRHFITDKGKAELKKALAESSEPLAEPTIVAENDQAIAVNTDPKQAIDDLLARALELHEKIKAALNMEPFVVEDKDLKLSVLEGLMPVLADDIVQVLSGIADDLRRAA